LRHLLIAEIVDDIGLFVKRQFSNSSTDFFVLRSLKMMIFALGSRHFHPSARSMEFMLLVRFLIPDNVFLFQQFLDLGKE